MSQENVEIVRRRDRRPCNREDIDARSSTLAPDIDLDWSRLARPERRRLPWARRHVGASGRTWLEAVSSRRRSSRREFIDSRASMWSSPITGACTGRGSGIEVDVAGVHGRRPFATAAIVRWTMYSRHAEALKAVGLEE